MVSYILTVKAVEDLSEIWNYTFDVWSEIQADKYYDLLFNSFQELAEGKATGKLYPEVKADIFGLKSGQHIIFYRILENSDIEITRILHSNMNLKSCIQD